MFPMFIHLLSNYLVLSMHHSLSSKSIQSSWGKGKQKKKNEPII